MSENELGAVFTCGAWSVQGGRFLVGIARDKYGTRVTVCMCLFLVAIGSLLIACSESNNLAGICFGMLFLGMGSGAQLCVQPVAGLFPEATSTAMATLSGAFQLSGLVFLTCSLVAKSGAERFGAYLGHALFVAVLFMFSLKLLPKGVSFAIVDVSSETKGNEKDVDNSLTIDEVDVSDDSKTKAPEEAKETDSVPVPTVPSKTHTSPAVHFGKSRKQLFTCDEFLALIFWFSVMVTPSQYYVLSIGYQLERMGDTDGSYSTAFGLIYGFSAPLAPLAGLCADTMGVGFAQGMASILSAIGFALLFVDDLSAQYFGMACYSVGRMMLFATFFANIGRRFGYVHYGSLVGVGMLTSAVLSMLQYPAYQAALGGDDALTNVNVVCLVSTVACVPYCVWLGARERREWKRNRDN